MDTAIANDSYEISWISDNYLKFIIKKSPVKKQTTSSSSSSSLSPPTSPKLFKKSSPHKRERLQLDNFDDDDDMKPTTTTTTTTSNLNNTTISNPTTTTNTSSIPISIPIKIPISTNSNTNNEKDNNSNNISELTVPELTIMDFNTKKKKHKKQQQQQESKDVDFQELEDVDIEKQDDVEIKSMDKLVLNPIIPNSSSSSFSNTTNNCSGGNSSSTTNTTTTTTTTTSTTATGSNTPNTSSNDKNENENEKQQKDDEKTNLNYNGNTILGTRDENQDAFFHKFLENDKIRIIGVFDGHGDEGMDASATTRDVVSNCIEQEILNSSSTDKKESIEFFDKCIINSLSNANESLLEKGKTSGDWGTTATLAIINNNNIRVGWVGDSMAVLFKLSANGKYTPIQLSNDHKPENPLEKKRITSVGGRVVYRCGCWRVVPNRLDYSNDEIMKQRLALNMSRALGHIVLSKYGVSSEPEFHSETLNTGDYVILASDGLWNVLDLKTICKYIKKSSSIKELTDLLLSVVESKCENFKMPCDNVTICCYKHS